MQGERKEKQMELLYPDTCTCLVYPNPKEMVLVLVPRYLYMPSDQCTISEITKVACIVADINNVNHTITLQVFVFYFPEQKLKGIDL